MFLICGLIQIFGLIFLNLIIILKLNLITWVILITYSCEDVNRLISLSEYFLQCEEFLHIAKAIANNMWTLY